MGIFSMYERQLWVLVTVSFIHSLGTSIAFPFISLYLYQHRGISMTEVGLLLMVSAAIGGLFQIVSGELCDRVGRKALMIAGTLLQCIGFLLLAISIIYGLGYMEFFIFLVVLEIAIGLYYNVPSIMTSDIAGPEKQNGAFSLTCMGSNMGFAVGPVCGGLIAMFSYSAMFFMTAIISFICMSVCICLLNDTKPGMARRSPVPIRRTVFGDRPFLLFCCISLILWVVYAQILTTLSSYTGSFVHISESSIGLLFSINGLMIILFQYPITRCFERFRLTTSLAAGSIMFALGFGALGLCNSFEALAGCIIVITLGELIFIPPSLTIVAQMSTPEFRGRYMSIAGLMGGAGFSIGPFLGGLLMDVFYTRITMMWFTIGALAVFCMVGFLCLRSRISESADRPSLTV